MSGGYRWCKVQGHWGLVKPPGDNRFAVPIGELLTAGDRPPADDGDSWSMWVYHADPPQLSYGARYWIDLGRCETSAQILDWLAQLAHKTWITSHDLGELVRALDDILDLQCTRCGFGVEQSCPRGKHS